MAEKIPDYEDFEVLKMEYQPSALETKFPAVEIEEDTPHLLITHKPTGSQWKAYRRHEIDAATGLGRAYYWVVDLRGLLVGEANAVRGLLSMLSQAVKDMSSLFAAEDSFLAGREKEL